MSCDPSVNEIMTELILYWPWSVPLKCIPGSVLGGIVRLLTYMDRVDSEISRIPNPECRSLRLFLSGLQSRNS